jgi:hypothetical protein
VAEFRLKVGDRLPKLRMVLADSAGVALDLTAATVALRGHARGSAAVLGLTGTASVITALAGIVEYAWGAAEPLPAGLYDLEWVVTKSGLAQTVPTSGYVVLVVEPALT